ncbi:MAG: MFS transporter [Anaerolineaceae bacterium]|nr:MFS transporter [Anaerolineaceae bacterium]
MKSVTAANPKPFQTAAFYFALLAIGFFQVCLGPTFPDLAEQTGTNLETISSLVTVLYFGYFLGSFFGGKLFDRLPGKPILMLSLLVGAFVLFMIPTIHNFYLLALLVFLMGIATCVIDIGANTLLVWVHHEKSGPYMNGLHLFYAIGAIFTPLLIGQAVTASGSIRFGYHVLALLTVIIALFFLIIPSFPRNQIVSEHEPSIKLIGRHLIIRTTLLVFFMLTMGGTINSYANWIYTYIITQFPAIPAFSAYQLTSLYWIMITIGRLIAIPAAAKFSASAILNLDLIGTLCGSLILLLFPHQYAMLIVGVVLVGISIASVFPSTILVSNQLIGSAASANRWLFMGSSVGGMLLPWLIGQNFETNGPGTVTLYNTVFIILALIVFFILRRDKNKSIAQTNA